MWLRPAPDFSAPHIDLLFINTPIKVLSVYGIWMEVEWNDSVGYHHGWALAEWISLLESVPAERITPTPTQ